MSQAKLANAIGTISVTGGRNERDEVKPYVNTCANCHRIKGIEATLNVAEVASKIAEALELSLNYHAVNSKLLLKKYIVKCITDTQQLPTDDRILVCHHGCYS